MSQGRDSGVVPSGENSELVEGVESEREGTSNVLLTAPHVLAMSATPIPRTLALAMHGDMSISQVCCLAPAFLICQFTSPTLICCHYVKVSASSGMRFCLL